MEERNIIRDRQGRQKNKANDSDKGKGIAEDEDTSPPSEHAEGSSSGIPSWAAASFGSEYVLSTASSSAASPSTASSSAASSSVNAYSDTGSSDLRARLQRKQKNSRPGRHDATSYAEPSSRRNSSFPYTDSQSAIQPSAYKATVSNEGSPTDSAFAASNETHAHNSSQELPDRAKAEKNARRNAKKKAKKREKKLTFALLGTSSSTDQGEVFSEERAPETCANSDINLGDEPTSQETNSVDQLCHSQININDSTGDSSSSITDSSELKEPMVSIPEDGSTQTKDHQFSVSERPEKRHDGQLHCCDDPSTKDASDRPDLVILDSVPAGHEAITEAGYDVNPSSLEHSDATLSKEICCTGTKECFSDRSSVNGTAVTKFQTQGCSTRAVKLVVPGKRKKQAKKIPKNGQERKENGPSARQKVQRDKVLKSGQSEDDTLSRCAKKDPSSSPVKKSTDPFKNDPGLKILSRPNRLVLGNGGDEPSSGEKYSSDSSARGAHCLDTELSKILVALNDSYRARQLCEALQVGTGNPLAEFERLIGAATPAICLWDRGADQPLCGNEIPHISLEHLWTWYIEPGSYGIMVSSEDFGYSNSTGFRLSDFHAHFVPSLSAVQLFEKSRAFGMDDHLPDNHNISSAPVHAEVAEDPELIFEYFESDLPQFRPPLHEKIRDLSSGIELSSDKTYGDPTKLCSMKLNQLHPRSWFAVAWYPIYRIPIGELRASFLTFHLFSHLVIKNCTSGSDIMGNCVVSPVVGFRSYQAKRWLLSRQFGLSRTGDAPRSTSEILRERLQTLERAASVLARGEVRKENKKVANKHPDYEFFFSRGP